MSKSAESSPNLRSSDAQDDDISCVKSTSRSPKSNEQDTKKYFETEDSSSERSASPLRDRKKSRHKRIARKRSLSYSPRKLDKQTRKEEEDGACRCLGVFGLSSYTEERDLKEVFSAYGDIEKLCLIYDKQSGHSKGFGFVYFESTRDAITARKETQGLILDGRHIRVDYSLTLEPHPPTPGKYQGRRRYYQGSRSSNRVRDHLSYRAGYRDRSHHNDANERKRYVRDEYDDFYDRSSRKHYYSSRRH